MPPREQPQPPVLPLSLEPAGNITAERLGRVKEAYDNANSEGTRNLYAKHWSYFVTWCDENGFRHLPAKPATIAVYITERASEVAISTINTSLAAIRSYHEDAGLTSPTIHPSVRRVKKGLTNTYPRAAAQVPALDNQPFAAIIAAAARPKKGETQDRADRRAAFDIALISFMRDAMLRRSEAAAARWKHVDRTREGEFVLEIPSSKTDQIGKGAFVFLSKDTVKNLATMLRLRGGEHPKPDDLIFGISGRQIANRIKAAAKHANLGADFSGHSPRIGMAHDMAIENIDISAIAQAGRWSSTDTVLKYIEKIEASRNGVARWHETQDPDEPTNNQ